MKTRAAVLLASGEPFQILSLDLEPPKAGEVLVKLAACGVCHSDYHLMKATTSHPFPCVAGHEGAGVVETVGEGVTSVKPGDRVILSWQPSCGRCFYCHKGQVNLCEAYTPPLWAGTMLDGTTRLSLEGRPVYHYTGLAAFSERSVVPEGCCVRLEPSLDLKVAALVGCAVATGLGAALYTAAVRPGDSVVVFGAGGVGLNVIQGARLCEASTIVSVDANPVKAEMAKRFGATHTLTYLPDGEKGGAGASADSSDAGSVIGQEALLGAVRDLTGGRGADHAFEAVGTTHMQEVALEAARPGGQVILVGLSPMGSSTNLPGAKITRQEKVVRGSYYGSVHPHRDFPMMVELSQAGKIDLKGLITQEYRLDDINEAFDSMLTGRVSRGVIVFDT